jgi:hypothetical protein
MNAFTTEAFLDRRDCAVREFFFASWWMLQASCQSMIDQILMGIIA